MMVREVVPNVNSPAIPSRAVLLCDSSAGSHARAALSSDAERFHPR